MKRKKRLANQKGWFERASLMLCMMGWRMDGYMKRDLLDFYKKGHDPATSVMVLTR